MIILDTNVLSGLMRPEIPPQLSKWLRSQDDPLATTSITVMEITYGLARLPEGRRRDDLEERFAALVREGDGLPVHPLSAKAAALAGHLQARRTQLGLPASQADMMIAGICAQHEAVLATRNTRDFLHLDLELVDPYSSEDG